MKPVCFSVAESDGTITRWSDEMQIIFGHGKSHLLEWDRTQKHKVSASSRSAFCSVCALRNNIGLGRDWGGDGVGVGPFRDEVGTLFKYLGIGRGGVAACGDRVGIVLVHAWMGRGRHWCVRG